MLAAGLDGVKKKLDPGDQIQEDIFKMTKSERIKRGIGVLPANLGEAQKPNMDLQMDLVL